MEFGSITTHKRPQAARTKLPETVQTIKDRLRANLVTRYKTELVDAALDAYTTAKQAAFLDDFQKVESNIGQLCEAAIRICRDVVTGSYTPIGDSSFKVEAEINACLSAAKGREEDEPLRLLIPHTIRAMYWIRNRRGVDHLSKIKPNHIDARALVAQADWVLAELYRLATTHDFEQAQTVVDSLVERQLPVIEKIRGDWKLLKTDFELDDAVLVIIYHDDDLKQSDLVRIIKESQPSVSRAIERLDRKGLLHKKDRSLTITSAGRRHVETLPALQPSAPV